MPGASVSTARKTIPGRGRGTAARNSSGSIKNRISQIQNGVRRHPVSGAPTQVDFSGRKLTDSEASFGNPPPTATSTSTHPHIGDSNNSDSHSSSDNPSGDVSTSSDNSSCSSKSPKSDASPTSPNTSSSSLSKKSAISVPNKRDLPRASKSTRPVHVKPEKEEIRAPKKRLMSPVAVKTVPRKRRSESQHDRIPKKRARILPAGDQKIKQTESGSVRRYRFLTKSQHQPRLTQRRMKWVNGVPVWIERDGIPRIFPKEFQTRLTKHYLSAAWKDHRSLLRRNPEVAVMDKPFQCEIDLLIEYGKHSYIGFVNPQPLCIAIGDIFGRSAFLVDKWWKSELAFTKKQMQEDQTDELVLGTDGILKKLKEMLKDETIRSTMNTSLLSKIVNGEIEKVADGEIEILKNEIHEIKRKMPFLEEKHSLSKKRLEIAMDKTRLSTFGSVTTVTNRQDQFPQVPNGSPVQPRAPSVYKDFDFTFASEQKKCDFEQEKSIRFSTKADAMDGWEAMKDLGLLDDKTYQLQQSRASEFISFKYIHTHVYHSSAVLIQPSPFQSDFDPVLYGCDCSEDCDGRCKCVGSIPEEISGKYDSEGRLEVISEWEPNSVAECNKMCPCGDQCKRKVVQKADVGNVSVTLELFEEKGWGVIASKKIIKGEYVCEYLGEIVNEAQADIRGNEYDKKGLSYLWTQPGPTQWDQATGRAVTLSSVTIDATHYGNIARFVNHSCDPNLLTCQVTIEPDCRLPRIAFFANRDIQIGEELSINYNYQIIEDNEAGIVKIRCYCGAKKCGGWLR